jgi:TolB-like protein/DNA-binding winged helix-turn-helix (wHTH) protein/Tfp pilus assembly protein PilF
MPSQDAIYRFGPYELRTRSREVYKSARKLKLRPQPFQVLAALLERSGDVVTRDELRCQLWPVHTFVDFEHGLNTAIKELRGLLNDSASEPKYIETIPRLGYRIIAPVQMTSPASRKEPPLHNEASATEIETAKREVLHPPLHLFTHRRWTLFVGVSVAVIAGLGSYVQWSRSRMRMQASSGRVMVAVLPFENLTGDTSQDYFSDGLTEEMIGQLGRLNPQQFGVIARTSVMHYRNKQESLQQIGRELGVQYVLEGSVRRELDHVRISAQLIQLKDQTHLWSRQYDREPSGLLALQAEIAQEIGYEIQTTLGGEHKPMRPQVVEASAVPANSEAYDLYLRGQYFWNKRTVAGFQKAIDYFQQAIQKDPNYAPAYAGLADCYALIGGYSTAPATEFMPKARAAATRALEINENLAEAHTVLALIVQNYDWDWETSEKAYRRAIELNPNYATAHHWYAEHLVWLSRFDEALRESDQARQLDPLSLIIATDHAEILYLSRQYDRAIKELRTVRRMEPNFPRAGLVVNALVEKGLYADALEEVEDERRAFGQGPWLPETLAYVYGRAGRPNQARQSIQELVQMSRHQEIDPASIAWAYVGVGDKDRAFSWLEKAYAQHSNILHTLKVEPGFDSLRRDSRFQDLLSRVHLAL